MKTVAGAWRFFPVYRTFKANGLFTLPRTGNDGFLYYAMYCTHYTWTGTGNGTSDWWVPNPFYHRVWYHSLYCNVYSTLHSRSRPGQCPVPGLGNEPKRLNALKQHSLSPMAIMFLACTCLLVAWTKKRNIKHNKRCGERWSLTFTCWNVNDITDKPRKHSSGMRTNRAVTWMSSDWVAMMPIVHSFAVGKNPFDTFFRKILPHNTNTSEFHSTKTSWIHPWKVLWITLELSDEECE